VTSPVDLPRAKLAELVARRDVSICQNANDCADRLRSECGLEHDDECAALVAAVDTGSKPLNRGALPPQSTYAADRLTS
jgi:hypothetical protein